MKKRDTITCIVLTMFFIFIAFLVVFSKNEFIDTSIYNIVRSLSSSVMDKYFIFFTKFCNTLTIVCVVLIFIIIFRNRYGIWLTASTIISATSNVIIKNIIRRARPDHLRLITQGGYSFPSGHAMISIAVYGLLFYFVVKKIKNKPLRIILSIILIFIILTVGISRIYVGVHYPTDVIAGYLLAIIELIILINIFNDRGLLNEKNID